MYGGCRQVVKTSVCGTDIHGFEPHHPPHFKTKEECPLWTFFFIVMSLNSHQKYLLSFWWAG